MDQNKYIDLDHISMEIGIEKADLFDLLNIYHDEMHQEMQNINEQLYKQNWTDLQHTIHNVKGVSANLCIQPMFDKSAAIDSMLKSGDFTSIRNEVEDLINIYEAIAAEILYIMKLNNYNTQA